MTPRTRTVFAVAAAVVVAGLLAAGARWALFGPSGPPNVIFVVLDTVRSDHTSLCGYERPTTPNLDALARRYWATSTCGGVAPGTWTLPSHASYMTGLDPVDHGAHAITSGIEKFSGVGSNVRAYEGDTPTLAELFTERGYQTAAYSANPVVSVRMGLLRGFSRHRVSKKWGDYFGEGKFRNGLRRVLSRFDKDKPFFLFVNIANAHRPWFASKGDQPWSPPQAAVPMSKGADEGQFQRFVEGRMPADEQTLLLERLQALYDMGVYRADRNLGTVLKQLDQGGHCDRGCRIVVTSDHGELLGEHQLLDHGNVVWEENQRVPVVMWSTAGAPRLPEPLNAIVAHQLLATGELPSPLPPVQSTAWPHVRRCALTDGKAFCDMAAAIWEGSEKFVWDGDGYGRYDLTADPGESNRLALAADHPTRAALEALSERVRQDVIDPGEPDVEVLELLRAAGYLE